MAKGKLTDDELRLILTVDANQAQKAIHDLEGENRNLEQSNKILRKEMTRLAAEGKKNTQEYKNLDASLKSNNRELEKNRAKIREHEKTLGLENMTMKQLQKRAQDLQRQMNNTAKNLQPEAYRRLEKELQSTQKQMNTLKEKSQDLDNVLKNSILGRGSIATFMGNMLTQAVNLMGKFIGDTFKKIKEFEQANADLASILGVSRKEISALTEEAKRLGAITEYTATQVTFLQTELAKLGFSQTEVSDMTEDVLSFATATGAELPAAAALGGAALRMFGLESKEMNRVVSAMAVGTTKSALSFNYLEAAMSTVGPIAKTFGFTIEDTVALLGTLANSGFNASSAATATRNILLNLADSGGKLATELGRPIKTLDDLAPAFAELKAKGVDLNETLELTDKRSVAAFNTFLDNAKSIETLRDSVTDVGSSLKKMVDERLNTVEGAIKIMESAWEGLMLTMSGSNGTIKKIIDWISEFIGEITKLITGQSEYQKEVEFTIKALLVLIATLTAYTAGNKLATFWNTKLKIALQLTNIELIKKNALVAGARIAVLAYNVATALLTGNITRARAAMHLLNLTIKANPLGLLLSAVAAVAVAIALFKKKTDELNEVQKISADIQQRQNELTKQYTESIISERTKLNTLVKTIVDINGNNDLRNSLIKKLQETYPSFLKNLDLEKTTNEELLSRLRSVNGEYDKKLRSLALQAKLDANAEASVKAETRKIEIEEELVNLKQQAYKMSDKDYAARKKKLEDEYNALNNNIDLYQKAINSYSDQMNEIKQQELEIGTSQYYKKQIDSLDSAIDVQEKRLEEAVKNGAQKEEEYYRNIVEGYKKEREAAQQHYNEVLEIEKKAEEERLKEEELIRQKEKKNKKDDKESGIKSAFDARLQDIENEWKERRLIIDLNENKEWESEQEHQALLLAAEENYLKKRIEFLSQFHSSHKKLDAESNSKLLDAKLKLNENSIKQDEQLIAGIRESGKKELETIQAAFENEQSALKQQYDARQITKEQYDARLVVLEYNTAKSRQEVITAAGEKMKTLELQNENVRLKALETTGKERIEAERKTLEKLSELNKNYYENDRSIREQYGKITVEEEKARELARIDALRNNTRPGKDGKPEADPLISEEAAGIARAAIEKKYEEMKFNVRREYGLVKMDELYQSELDALKEQYDKKMLSEEEFEIAKFNLKLKYAKEYAQKAGEFAQAGADTVKAFEESETASLDAEYTKRQSALTEQYNQGILSQEEYQKQKEQLDYEQRVKELEIQKKYADVNFAMQVAQIISSGAVAAINAYSAMAGIPVVGPALGAAAAALVAVTTALQVAKAKAERDRVKAMTIESPGGGASSGAKTGEIRLKQGFAEGGYNAGGYTGDGGKYEVKGYFPNGEPYHAGEYIIAQDELRQPMVAQWASRIETIRRRRTGKNAQPGFAEGGYTGNTVPDRQSARKDDGVSSRLIAILERIEHGDITVRTNYGVTELEAEQKRKMEAESKFTR